MSDKSYNFAMKALTERFKGVQVADQAQAVKLVYDADIAAADKSDAFLIYRTSLQSLPGMPKVLTECEEKVRKLKQGASDVKTWEIIATQSRENARGSLKLQIAEYQSKMAKMAVDMRRYEDKIQQYTDEELEERKDSPPSAVTKHAKLSNERVKMEKIIDDLGMQLLELAPERPFTAAERDAARLKEERLTSHALPTASWPDVLKAILGVIFKLSIDEFEDNRLTVEFKAICVQRKAQCSMSSGPLQYATALNEEVKLLNWGLAFLVPSKALRDDHVQEFEHDAQQRFLQAGDMRQFNWRVAPRHKALGCMDELVEHLKTDLSGYGPQTHEVVALVHRANIMQKTRSLR